ncbi:MAG: glycosyltransferase family 2 protein, partial [Candidatus Omnitrophica bacterium]|nr:glycosyltransferase family 2 protein [Candidatus Omnitrophota bacterium]
GVKYAERYGFEYVVLMDADGQHNPQDISVLLDILKNDKADFVIGSRFSEENIYQEGISRKLGRAFFSFLIYCLSGAKIKDPTSGFQAFNRKTQKIYSSELFPIDYPDADVLLLFAYHNLRIKEVPVKMNTTSGKSMHSGIRSALYYIYKMLLSMLIVLSYKKEIKRKAQNGY